MLPHYRYFTLLKKKEFRALLDFPALLLRFVWTLTFVGLAIAFVLLQWSNNTALITLFCTGITGVLSLFAFMGYVSISDRLFEAATELYGLQFAESCRFPYPQHDLSWSQHD